MLPVRAFFMHAVVVFFIGYSFNLKIANQTISICSLFVLALVDKPNTVQTILPAVIADTKSSTNPAFAYRRRSIRTNKTNP
jgi:hypothetical protein